MNNTIDLEKFKTGLELEKEFNRIIKLALTYQMDQIEAEQILEEIYDYGASSGKFTKGDQTYYKKRRNVRNNGTERTHLEMAKNIQECQKREHRVFLYFVEWLRKENPDDTVGWAYNGSDDVGYMMIVNDQLRNVIEPDYKVKVGKRVRLIESKSFFTPPTFKIANINRYRTHGKKCFLVFRYKKKHYITGFYGMEHILKLPKIKKYKQPTVIMSEENMNKFLDKKWIKELTGVR